jgi:hypothetical protein
MTGIQGKAVEAALVPLPEESAGSTAVERGRPVVRRVVRLLPGITLAYNRGRVNGSWPSVPSSRRHCGAGLASSAGAEMQSRSNLPIDEIPNGHSRLRWRNAILLLYLGRYDRAAAARLDHGRNHVVGAPLRLA